MRMDIPLHPPGVTCRVTIAAEVRTAVISADVRAKITVAFRSLPHILRKLEPRAERTLVDARRHASAAVRAEGGEFPSPAARIDGHAMGACSLYDAGADLPALLRRTARMPGKFRSVFA